MALHGFTRNACVRVPAAPKFLCGVAEVLVVPSGQVHRMSGRPFTTSTGAKDAPSVVNVIPCSARAASAAFAGLLSAAAAVASCPLPHLRSP